MSNTYDDKDLILPKIKITSANNRIIFNHNGTNLTGSITAGDYYAYLPDGESAEFIAAYPPLYTAMIGAVNTAGTGLGTWTMTVATPVSSSAFTNSTVCLARTAGTTFNYGINTLDTAMTFDARYFGFNKDEPMAVAGTQLSGSYTALGKWTSPKQHSSRLGNTINVQYHNNGNYNIRQTVKWTKDRFRMMNYNWIFANHVSTYRNNNSDYAAAGYMPLAQYDHGNYFNETWESLSDGSEALIVYNDGDVDLSVTNHQYESFSLAREYLDDISTVKAIAGQNGEIYNLNFVIWRNPYESMLAAYPDDVTYYLRED